VRCTARKFRHFRYERLVFAAPIDDDFIFEHCFEPSFALRSTPDSRASGTGHQNGWRRRRYR
jgi:hypothetical protein